MDYITTMGLEVHTELSTKTKIFCSCSTEFGGEPNTHVCEVCSGMPGTLPVLNEQVVEYAIRVGLATNCEITRYNKFDRKNYFYPDLPKAYQVSQLYLPICRNGHIDIEVSKKLRFMRFNAECRRIIVETGISKEHALIVLKIPDQQIQRSILRKISDSKLSLKKTEELVEYEIEKIKSDELIFSEQKEKRNFTDMRLLTNTVKRSVDLMKKSGVEAGYEVEQSGEETKIIISIPKMI